MEIQTQALLIILFAISLAAIYQFIFIIIYSKKFKTSSLALRDENARSKFAEARRSLYRYMAEKEIDSNDGLFQSLYIINTQLMKAKGNYAQYGKHLVNLFSGISKGKGSATQPLVSKEYIDVIKKTFDAFGFISLEYSWGSRMLCHFLEKVDKKYSRGTHLVINILTIDMLEKKRQQRVVREEYEQMQEQLNQIGIA